MYIPRRKLWRWACGNLLTLNTPDMMYRALFSVIFACSPTVYLIPGNIYHCIFPLSTPAPMLKLTS